MSLQQQSVHIATETLSELYSDKSSTASILRRCLTISILLGDIEAQKWIKTELEGYPKGLTYEELRKIAPEYRQVMVAYKDPYGRPIIIPPQLSKCQEEIVIQTIGEIEECSKNGITYLSAGLLDIVREMGKKFGIPVYSEHVSEVSVKNIIENVRNRALDYINSVIKEQNLQKVAIEKQHDKVSEKVDEFTYEAPDEGQFIKALLVLLESKGSDKIVSLLSNAKCIISRSGDYSKYQGGTIWNAYATTVSFAIPTEEFGKVTKTLTIDDKKIIRETCNELMPKDSGLEVTSVSFTPSIAKPEMSTDAQLKAKTLVKFVSYETIDKLLQGHIEEIDKAYTYECYTATFILCRKVLENLIIHQILKKKYPDKTKNHREKYFDFNNNRNLDFNVLLANLRKSSPEFAPENKLVERICQLADGFKEDANEMTHSLYHLATKKELDEKCFQAILDLIKRLEESLEKPKTP